MHALPLCLLILLTASCASTTAYRVERDPETGAVRGEPLSQYFETRAKNDSGTLGVHLVLDIETDEVIVTDNCPVRATAYVHNLSGSAIDYETMQLVIDGKSLPAKNVAHELAPHSYVKSDLGSATISGCRFELPAVLTWSLGGAVRQSELSLQRTTVDQIVRDNTQWKNRDKSVPEFFPDSL